MTDSKKYLDGRVFTTLLALAFASWVWFFFWAPNRDVALDLLERRTTPAESGELAVFKGTAWPGAAERAIVHRSPPSVDRKTPWLRVPAKSVEFRGSIAKVRVGNSL